MKKRLITLRVNGEEHEIAVEPRRLLVEALRDDLGLTGTKRGCESGVCGCCTVLLDGRNIKSCLMLALQAQGAEVTTIEGLRGEDGGLHPIQEAYVNFGALQCGYCTPGFIMTTRAFLDENPRPTEAEVREALSGNICRCTGYVKIVEAILAASGQDVPHAHA
ncbi:MAG: (2Fe-2S)-binding protein [Nitrospinota bacterium]